MTQFAEICTRVVEALRQTSINVPVDLFPKDSNPRPKHGHGAVFVRFESLQAASIGIRMTQASTLFSVFSVSKELHGPNSAISVLEFAIDYMHGNVIALEDGRQVVFLLQSVDLLTGEDGWWVYQAQFQVQYPMLSGVR